MLQRIQLKQKKVKAAIANSFKCLKGCHWLIESKVYELYLETKAYLKMSHDFNLHGEVMIGHEWLFASAIKYF